MNWTIWFLKIDSIWVLTHSLKSSAIITSLRDTKCLWSNILNYTWGSKNNLKAGTVVVAGPKWVVEQSLQQSVIELWSYRHFHAQSYLQCSPATTTHSAFKLFFVLLYHFDWFITPVTLWHTWQNFDFVRWPGDLWQGQNFVNQADSCDTGATKPP